MGFKDFLRECHNRSLFKLLSVYVVSGWGVIQVLSVLATPLNLPQKAITYVIILLLVCLPLYMFLLWRYKLKDFESPITATVRENIKNEISFKRQYFISLSLIGLFSFFAVGLIYQNSLADNLAVVSVEETNKIAIVDFTNNTGDEDLDVIGSMSSDWLIHGITQFSSNEVISPETLNSYADLMGINVSAGINNSLFNKVLKPNKLISGSYFKQDDQLVFNCVIQDMINNTVLVALPKVICDQNSPLDCIEEVKQMVLGYLNIDPDKRLHLQENPPNYEAYKKKLMADANYDQPEIYLSLLDEAIAIDPNYFEPQVLRVQHYYNVQSYKVSDSLNQIIASNPKLTRRQKNLLQFCEALIEGKNDKIYRKFEYEYNITPDHLETNSTNMVLLVQFINKPELVEDVFNVENMREFNIENCIHCKYRYFMMGSAYNELGEYDKTIELLAPILEFVDYDRIDFTYISALISTDDLNNLKQFLDKKELLLNTESLNKYYIFIAEHYLVGGDKDEAHNYLSKVIDNSLSSLEDRADAYYLLDDYNMAKPFFDQLLEKEPESKYILSRCAVIYEKLGNDIKALELLKSIEAKRAKYDYGDVDYKLAHYYARIGDDESSFKFLMKSIAQGNVYLNNNFKNDAFLQNVAKAPRFQEILTFWH